MGKSSRSSVSFDKSNATYYNSKLRVSPRDTTQTLNFITLQPGIIPVIIQVVSFKERKVGTQRSSAGRVRKTLTLT
jgi:hypothetical protein